MKFTLAWSNVLSQNATLRTVLASLCFFSTLLLVAVLFLSLKEPLVIERGCYTKPLPVEASPYTEAEVKTFLEIALTQRFDSDAVPLDSFLSEKELSARAKEQDELKKNDMNQKVVIRTIELTNHEAAIMADRLISVKDIRSAFSFPLKVSLIKIHRTATNPYGLTLAEVKPITKDTK